MLPVPCNLMTCWICKSHYSEIVYTIIIISSPPLPNQFHQFCNFLNLNNTAEKEIMLNVEIIVSPIHLLLDWIQGHRIQVYQLLR